MAFAFYFVIVAHPSADEDLILFIVLSFALRMVRFLLNFNIACDIRIMVLFVLAPVY